MKEIGRETSDQLEFIPARVEVVRHVRPKYACPTCKEGVSDRADAASPCSEEHRDAEPPRPGRDLEVRGRPSALPAGEDLRAAGARSLASDARALDGEDGRSRRAAHGPDQEGDPGLRPRPVRRDALPGLEGAREDGPEPVLSLGAAGRAVGAPAHLLRVRPVAKRRGAEAAASWVRGLPADGRLRGLYGDRARDRDRARRLLGARAAEVRRGASRPEVEEQEGLEEDDEGERGAAGDAADPGAVSDREEAQGRVARGATSCSTGGVASRSSRRAQPGSTTSIGRVPPQSSDREGDGLPGSAVAEARSRVRGWPHPAGHEPGRERDPAVRRRAQELALRRHDRWEPEPAPTSTG